MKKLIVLSVILCMSGVSYAEFPGNPDKVPSIGLNYGGVSESGDVTVIAAPSSTKQDIDMTSGQLILDFRAPVSNHWTLNAAVGITGTSTEAKETSLLFGQKSDTTGFTFNIGVRYYLQ